MKIEITQFSSNPSNTLMDIYEVPATRPFCRIYEENLYEVMTDAQIKSFEAGKIIFNLPKNKLIEHCKQLF